MVFSYVYNLYKAMFNVNTSRPLIPREQTYVLDRKLVTIHSDDRDIKKWPFSNHFEVELPQVMENVESHQLALRGIILGVMSEYSQDDVAGREGKQALADSIKDALNIFLEDKEGFGGVEGIHFTSFVLQ